ncbi:MAG: hypothetical protein JWM59_3336 [Verrucomicrobiales bacterium]|nr:hypothetical protein [Verrucomicrobiales bacterium]
MRRPAACGIRHRSADVKREAETGPAIAVEASGDASTLAAVFPFPTSNPNPDSKTTSPTFYDEHRCAGRDPH